MVDLVPIDDDPFTAAAPSSGNIMDPASQPVSPWADSPIAKVGRLIGERGLGGAMPGRTISPAESMPDFWQRWKGMIGGLTQQGSPTTQPTSAPPTDLAAVNFIPVEHDPFAAGVPIPSDQNNRYKLVPVNHDPFAPKKMSTLGITGDMQLPPEELIVPPTTREPNDDPMVNVERSLPLPPDRNSFMPQDVMDYRGSLPPQRDI